jgi:HEPN domain
MNSHDQAHYRLRLAEGFFDEAREDMHSQRWRSCVSNGQLAAENAAKAVLGLLGPIGRTHNPSVFLWKYPPGTRGHLPLPPWLRHAGDRTEAAAGGAKGSRRVSASLSHPDFPHVLARELRRVGQSRVDVIED